MQPSFEKKKKKKITCGGWGEWFNQWDSKDSRSDVSQPNDHEHIRNWVADKNSLRDFKILYIRWTKMIRQIQIFLLCCLFFWLILTSSSTREKVFMEKKFFFLFKNVFKKFSRALIHHKRTNKKIYKNWITLTRKYGKHSVRHTKHYFDLIRAHQQWVPWSPLLDIEPATTESRAETLPLSHCSTSHTSNAKLISHAKCMTT